VPRLSTWMPDLSAARIRRQEVPEVELL